MRRVRLGRVVFGAAIVVAAFGLFVATQNRNAWSDSAPRYVAVHRGSFVVLSSVWEWGPRGWMYDGFVMPPAQWRPSYSRVGDRYTTGSGQWSAPMWGVFVPVWLLGGIGVVVAARGVRWRGAREVCQRYGRATIELKPVGKGMESSARVGLSPAVSLGTGLGTGVARCPDCGQTC